MFGSALLVQFGLGGWTLCMATYKIASVRLSDSCTMVLNTSLKCKSNVPYAQLNVLSIEFASTTLFIICIGLELLLYCNYGNEVAVEVLTELIIYSVTDNSSEYCLVFPIMSSVYTT